MPTTPMRILIADDHNLIREGLKRIIEMQDDMVIVGESMDGPGAEASIRTLMPDVVIMDINMPGRSGLEVLRRIREEGLKTAVVMLTVSGTRDTLLEAVHIGADGYVLKDSDTQELIRAISDAFAGDTYIDRRLVKLLVENYKDRQKHTESTNKLTELSERELDVLKWMAAGSSNRDISDALFLSEKTVKNYATQIFRKLEVRDRVQATLYAVRNGIEQM